jgi:hypothetical protein
MSALDEAMVKSYERLVAGVARDPDSLDKPHEENEANSAPEKWVMIPWSPVSEDVKRAQEPTLTS